MPHSSRRTRKPFHAKRVISESEDGWSRVERTLSSRFGSAMIISESLPPVDRSLTVQKLQDEHKRCKQQWVDSEARQSLQQLLTRRMPEGGWPVDKAVCVALGSPSLSWANRNRSVWQLVMFMDLVDIVGANIKDDNKIKLYAQEPRFTSLDQEFLASLDISVLEQPQAEELADESSLIFIPCLEWVAELSFMIVAEKSPLYLTSSMHWVAEEAERTRNNLSNEQADSNSRLRKDCDDALAASKAVLNTHDEYKTQDTNFADGHSLSMSVYTLKHKDQE